MDGFLDQAPTEPMQPQQPLAPDAVFDAGGYQLGDAITDLQPRYPSWLYTKTVSTDPMTGERIVEKTLQPPKKPTVAQFETWAREDADLHTQLVNRDRRMLRLYRLTHTSIFDDGSDEEALSTDRFTSPEPKLQVNRLCAMVAGLDVQMQWPSRTVPEAEAARIVQAAGKEFLEQVDELHRSRGSHDFKHDLTFSAAVYGRICVFRGCDPDDEGFPWNVRLANPSTVFPTWGDKGGLLRVSQVSTVPLGRVLDRFDPDSTKGLAARLKKGIAGKKKVQVNDVDWNEPGELVDVSTRWHRFVSWSGTKILLEAHEYGKPQWTIEVMSGELTEGGMPSSTDVREQGLTRREIERGEDHTATGADQWDMAERWQSFLAGAEEVIRLDEAVHNLLLTQLELDTNPPQITTTPYKEMPPKADLRPGGHTKRRPNETTNPVQFPLRTNVIGPIAAKLAQMGQKAMLPDNVFGILEGQSASGFSENTLLASAKQGIAPYVKIVENTLTNLVSEAFWLFHGFGHLYVDNADGAWRVPAPAVDTLPWSPQEAQQLPFGLKSAQLNPLEVELRRELFDLVPFRPQLRLHKIDWRELTSIANAVGILMDKGLWGRPRAMGEVGVDDHIGETQQVIRDLMLNNPKMLELVFGPDMLLKSGDVSNYLAALTTVVGPALQQLMPQPPGEMPQPDPGSPAMPGAVTPGDPSVAGVQTVQGDSQAMVTPDQGIPGRPRTAGPDPSVPPGGPGGVM